MKAWNLSWQKLESYVKKSKNSAVAILPIGSFEQHSIHLPLSTDSLVVDYVSSKIEEKLKERSALFPTIYYACSAEHGGFPGTVAIDYKVFQSYIQNILESLTDAGFRKITIINSHGGNVACLSILQKDWNFRALKSSKVYLFHLVDDELSMSIFEGRRMNHADYVETSMVEAISPGSVDLSALGSIRNEDFRNASHEGIFSVYRVKEVSKSGLVESSKRFKSVDRRKGKEILDEFTNRIASTISKLSLE